MSAQAVDLWQRVMSSICADRIFKGENAKDSEIVPGAPFEVVYQVRLTPEPTPEEIKREHFLVDCD